MTMNIRIFRTIIVCLLVCGLSSCIRMDVGNTIGSVGKRVPKVVSSGELPVRGTEVFRREGSYYVSLPVVYVPERRCGVEFVPQLVGDFEFLDGMGGDGGGSMNRPYSREELLDYPVCYYYAEFAEENVSLLPSNPSTPGIHGYFRVHQPEKVRLIPSDELSLNSSDLLGVYVFADAESLATALPIQRAWYHYLLMPLQYAVMLGVDVPLSLISMPLTLPFFIDSPFAPYENE